MKPSFAFAVMCAGFTAVSAAAYGQDLSKQAMLGFLVQDICVDKAGNPVDVSPYGPNCPLRRPQSGSDPETYRKHDWPDQRHPQYALSGQQASDSVLYLESGIPVVEQLFDFGGDTNHHFLQFSHKEGDGGQAVLLINGWASLVMTEDAGDNKPQWFIGSDCKQSPQGSEFSWLVFKDDVSSGEWKASTAQLAKTFSSAACPNKFGPAYTRYRREVVEFPFRSVAAGNHVEISQQPLDVIISEHYGGSDIGSADHLERFYFARGVGWTRWERWENTNLKKKPDVPGRALDLDASGRCPTVAYSVSPGTGWYRVDCRTWTNIVHLKQPWPVNDFRWPAFEGLRPK